MRRLTATRALVALNAGLLLALTLLSLPHPASAQNAPAAANRTRGQYTMVTGRILGGAESGVYIVDASNMEVAALRYDPSRREMQLVGYRDLAADAGRPAQNKTR